ncbi:MAG: aldo/keto reductase [bacterium]|nr:aldo/keto reductase [bacterium]
MGNIRNDGRIVAESACSLQKETPAQLSLAWMLCKKPYLVPIPGPRRRERITENAGAADIELAKDEVAAIDKRLDQIQMSDVFGVSPVQK